MSKLQDIKRKVTRAASKRIMDQEDARIERARQEAREEATRERTQRRVQDARESERDRVLNEERSSGVVSEIANTFESATAAVDDGDGERLDDVRQAFASDFDGDGETLAEEFGLQSAARAEREDEAFRRLGDQVDNLNGGGQGGDRGAGLDGSSRGGGGLGDPIDPEDFGFGSSGGGLGDPIDPEDFGFGGDRR